MNPYQPQPTTDSEPAYSRGDWFFFGMVAGVLLTSVMDEVTFRRGNPVAFAIDWLLFQFASFF
jgi:hypothetical protein